jgi:hypothetical protein
MIRKLCSISLFLLFTGILSAQTFIKSVDLFNKQEAGSSIPRLNIVQDPALDTLMSRYILMNRNLAIENEHLGMKGYRIQIYSSSNRNAREESNKERATFMAKFPDIVSYPLSAYPAWFKIRAGDFRTKTEAYATFLLVSKEFPNAYLIPDYINFPDLIKK